MNRQGDRPVRSLPQALFDILDREVTLYQELLNILRQEQRALFAMKVDEVVTLSKKKESQLLKIRLVDEALQETARAFTAEREGKIITLSALASRATSEDAARVSQYLATLAAARDEILSLNVLNKRFVGDTLTHLNDAIAIITSTVSPPQPYHGRHPARRYSGLPAMISREV